MDFWDWIAWSIILALNIKGFIHYSKLDRQMKAENRKFGGGYFRMLLVLMLPWAIREAEKDYVREQENNRQGSQ